MKVLVTGTDGYIGTVLAPTLMERGHVVVGLDTGFYREGWLYNHGMLPRPLCINKDIRQLQSEPLNGFDAVVRTVLHGSVFCTLAVGRHLLERKAPGSIVSVVTTYAWTGTGFALPSACAKAGVLAMTRSLAVEWGDAGIRLNAIAPGPIPTEGAWSRLIAFPEAEKNTLERIPLGRFGTPEELANLAFALHPEL